MKPLSNNQPRQRIAYLMSRFPKISETFILYEILELERLGLQVEIFPLLRHNEPKVHPEAAPLVARAHYSSVISLAVVLAQLYWLLRHPVKYLQVWWQALRGNAVSPKFLLRALAVVPQAALFARQMQQLGVSHIHAHWATHPTLAAFVAHRLTGLPYSFTAHAHDIYVERAMLAEKIAAASFVVTISEFNRQFLMRHYGQVVADKTVVIHCGVDPQVFQPRAVNPNNAAFTLVCVAALQEKKGQAYLIDACALLKNRGIALNCLLLGEGEDRPKLEAQIARLGLLKDVSLLGFQPRDQVSAAVAAADVMVLPSVTTPSGRMEGIPVALMEALAASLPVVASNISGVPELVEDRVTGLLVPERDAHALADAIEQIYQDRALGQRLGAAGREKVLREFNLPRNAAMLRGLLQHDWKDASRRSAPALLRGIATPES